MSEIKVAPEELTAAGAAVARIGNEIGGLGGQVSTLQSGQAAAQPGTADALGEFIQTGSTGLAQLGTAVRTFGQATRTAGSVYTETDRNAIPATASGAPAGG